MTTYIKSINRKVWKVVEIKIEIADLETPTAAKEVLLQNNDIALSCNTLGVYHQLSSGFQLQHDKFSGNQEL